MRMAKATLLSTRGTHKVTIKELESIKVPKATNTWTPVPHVVIPDLISDLVKKNGWKFLDKGEERFQVEVSREGNRMFGITKIGIPGIEIEEAELAIGFRNSHDKTMAVRVALGANVTVCDNKVITGDLQVRRVHNGKIDVLEALEYAFEQIPAAAKSLGSWWDSLKTKKLTVEKGVSILADLVEAEALLLEDFMDARKSFISAYAGANRTIDHGGTLWSVYQSVTEQFKKHTLRKNQRYTINLNEKIREWQAS
jgi:hypothetical protein